MLKMVSIKVVFIIILALLICGYDASEKFEAYSSDPDIYRTTPEYITSRGFEYESHYVTTDDGYILTVFRIINPYIKKSERKRPIYIQHALSSSSDEFLYNCEGSLEDGIYCEGDLVNDCRTTFTRTIGFTLSACGYDVWLGNFRGNIYSKNHTTLDPYTDVRFWLFTIDDHALFDVPATIRYILITTKHVTLGYIGHSMGTTSMFMLQSYHPQFARIVKPFIALAPVVYLGHSWSIARLGVPLAPVLQEHPGPFGVPQNITEYVGAHICGNSLFTDLCAEITFATDGRDPKQTNYSRIPAYVGRSFQFSSNWVLVHFAQLIASNKFEKYSYGPLENLLIYGSVTPPQYNVSKITSRNIALFRGLNDAFSDNIDVQRLVDELTVPLLKDYIIPFPYWNHNDFVTAIEAHIYVVAEIIKTLSLFD